MNSVSTILSFCFLCWPLGGCKPGDRPTHIADNDAVQSESRCEFSADPKLQQQILETLPALDAFDGHYADPDSGTEGVSLAEGYRKLRELNNAADNEQQLVRQLVYFGTYGPGPETEIVALMIMHQLEITDGAIIEALAPCLNVSDPALRDAFHSRLSALANGESDEWLPEPLNPPAFEVYGSYVWSRFPQEK